MAICLVEITYFKNEIQEGFEFLIIFYSFVLCSLFLVFHYLFKSGLSLSGIPLKNLSRPNNKYMMTRTIYAEIFCNTHIRLFCGVLCTGAISVIFS